MNLMDAVIAVLGAPQNDIQLIIYYLVVGVAGLIFIFLPILIIRNFFRS